MRVVCLCVGVSGGNACWLGRAPTVSDEPISGNFVEAIVGAGAVRYKGHETLDRKRALTMSKIRLSWEGN